MKIETHWSGVVFASESDDENEILNEMYQKIKTKCDCALNNEKYLHRLIILTYY